MRRRATIGRFTGAAALAASLLWAPGAAALAAVDLSVTTEEIEGDLLSDGEVTINQTWIEYNHRRPGSRLTIRVPWIRINHTGNVTMGPHGPIIIGAGGPGAPAGQTSPAGQAEADFGDTYLREELVLMHAGKGHRPYLALLLDYKWSTANSKRGIGTGEDDYGAGFSIVQPLGQVVQFQGEAEHLWMGDPKGLDFRNIWKASAGLNFVSGRTVYRIAFEAREQVLETVPFYDPSGAAAGIQEVPARSLVRFDVLRRATDGSSARAGVWAGLSDGTERIGFMVEFATGGR